MLEPKDYFDLSDPAVADIFLGIKYVWEAVARLPEIVANLVRDERRIHGDVKVGAIIGEGPVLVSAGAVIESGAYVVPPVYIGPNATIRHGAYVRPGTVILEHAIVGHATEIKSSLMLPYSQAPHFAYVGDSILGKGVNLGAGTKLSNLTITDRNAPGPNAIILRRDGKEYNTGMRKFGAILGDQVQTGCNSVCNPGTLIGPGTLVYPNAVIAKGFYPAESIIKLRQQLEICEQID